MAASTWRSLPCSRRQLRLDLVLQCGQSFRWRQNSCGEWLGVISDSVWRLKQDDSHVYYQVYSRTPALPQTDTESKFLPNKAPERHPAVSHTRPTRQTPKSGRASHKPTASSTPDSKTAAVAERLQRNEAKTETTARSADQPHPGPVSEATVEGGEFMPRVKPEPLEAEDVHAAVLRDYFQLHVDTEALYHQWSQADPIFRETASDFWGIRLLRQDPVETLFAFICSSNNNIARISGMVEKLCAHFGEPIAEVDGTLNRSFPPVASLAGPGVEETLRELGFGYRAKFVATSARYIVDSCGEGWVPALRLCSYEEAKMELMKLCGVGAKVADCVCLMSLDKAGAIPVDTHVWQFAARNYLPKLQSAKSVTDKLYQETGDYFRNLWGQYAGWAQSVLFTAELRHMQSVKSSSSERTSEGRKPPKKGRVKTGGEVAESPKRAK